MIYEIESFDARLNVNSLGRLEDAAYCSINIKIRRRANAVMSGVANSAYAIHKGSCFCWSSRLPIAMLVRRFELLFVLNQNRTLATGC